MIVATTRGALIRGSSVDSLGDVVDAETTQPTPPSDTAAGRSLADFPVSIVERTRRELDVASGAWRTIRYQAGRCPAYVPVVAGDRIRDNRSGDLYLVEEVERMARGLSGRGSVTLSLRRTAP